MILINTLLQLMDSSMDVCLRTLKRFRHLYLTKILYLTKDNDISCLPCRITDYKGFENFKKVK